MGVGGRTRAVAVASGGGRSGRGRAFSRWWAVGPWSGCGRSVIFLLHGGCSSALKFCSRGRAVFEQIRGMIGDGPGGREKPFQNSFRSRAAGLVRE